MQIVLDTNVIVSALLSPASTPGKVLDAWDAGSYALLLSEGLIAEYLNVFNRPRLQSKHLKSKDEIDVLVARFRTRGQLVRADAELRVVTADPDDDVVVATAVAGNADYIVSGDKHLLGLGEHSGIRIVTPAVFLAILEHDL